MGGWESTRHVDGGMADGGMDVLEDERLGRYRDKGMGAWGTMQHIAQGTRLGMHTNTL